MIHGSLKEVSAGTNGTRYAVFQRTYHRTKKIYEVYERKEVFGEASAKDIWKYDFS